MNKQRHIFVLLTILVLLFSISSNTAIDSLDTQTKPAPAATYTWSTQHATAADYFGYESGSGKYGLAGGAASVYDAITYDDDKCIFVRQGQTSAWMGFELYNYGNVHSYIPAGATVTAINLYWIVWSDAVYTPDIYDLDITLITNTGATQKVRVFSGQLIPKRTDLQGYNAFNGLVSNIQVGQYITRIRVETYSQYQALDTDYLNLDYLRLDYTYTTTVPGAPTQNDPTLNSNGNPILSWTAPSNNGGETITGYRIYRSTTSGVEGSLLASVGVITSYTDTSAALGTTYYYTIRAVNSEGQGAASVQKSIKARRTPFAPTLYPPYRDPATDYPRFNWTAPINDGGEPIYGTRIYRSETNGTLGSWLYSVNYTISEYIDTSAVWGTTYYYTVCALNTMGVGDPSAQYMYKAYTKPGAPSISSLGYEQDGLIRVNWNAPAFNGGENITSYNLYRSTSSGVQGSLIFSGLTTSYLDTTVVAGTTYYYTVRAVNPAGEGNASTQQSKKAGTVPSAPYLWDVMLTGEGYPIINWSNPQYHGGYPITNFRIYRSTTLGVQGSLLTELESSIFVHTDLTAQIGTVYYYTVRAVNSEGEGAASQQKSIYPSVAPGAPDLLIPTHTPTGFPILQWNPPAFDGGEPIQAYRIFKSTEMGQEGDLLVILNSTVQNYTDTNVTMGVTYYYILKAENIRGVGNASVQRSIKAGTTPSEPRNLTLSHTPQGFIRLNWVVPLYNGGQSIMGYAIYRSLTSGLQGSWLANVSAGSLEYIDDFVSIGTTYYYTVRAINVDGVGSPSDQKSLRAGTVPTAPNLLNPGLAINGSVLLTWEVPQYDGGNAILQYNIYRSNSSGELGTLIQIVDASNLSFNDSNVILGTTYYYTIKAVNLEGESPGSVQKSVKACTAPSAPNNPQVSVNIYGKPVINWSAPSSNGGDSIQGYRIYRSTTSSVLGSLINSTGNATLSYTYNSAVAGTIYYYTIKAYNVRGEGNESTQVSVLAGTIPQGPNLYYLSTPGNGHIIIHWYEPSITGGYAITSYNIYRSTTSGVQGTLLGSVDSITFMFLDSATTLGTTYFYTVRAVNPAGEGLPSQQQNFTASVPPDAPTLLPLTLYSNGSINITWSVPFNGGVPIQGYKIYRSTINGSLGSLYAIVGTITAYTDSNVTLGTTYYYRIQAFNARGDGGISEQQGLKSCVAPSAPIMGTISLNTLGQPQLSWSAPTNNGGDPIWEYRIYRSTVNGSKGALIQTVPPNITSYTDTAVSLGTIYYYTVVAVNYQGEGALSVQRSIKALQPPNSPSLNSAVSFNNGSIRLIWSAPTNTGGESLTAYYVYRSTTQGVRGSLVRSLSGTTTQWIDNATTLGTTYYYTIVASNSYWNGSDSNQLGTMAGYYPEPVNLQSITQYTNRTFRLSWTFNNLYDQPVTHIYIYRSTIAGTLGTLLATLTTPTTSFFTDNAPATLGTVYYYTVIIRTTVGLSPNSTQQNARVMELPGAPTIEAITRQTNQNTIFWNQSGTGGSSYLITYIYYGTSRTNMFNYQTNINKPFVHTGISSSTPYYYKIVVMNEIGWTVETPIRCSITLAPTSLISESQNFSIRLTWFAPLDDDTIYQYKIFRSNATHSEFLLALIGNDTSFTDSLYYPGTHTYRVVAVGFAGDSDYSVSTTNSPKTWPGKITNITTVYHQRALTLYWNIPNNGNYPITRYYLYYETSPGTFEIIFDTNETTCYIYDLQVNRSYNFYIRAQNALGQGIPSDVITLYACDYPTQPTNLRTNSTRTEIRLQWNPSVQYIGFTTQYRVFRGTSPNQLTYLGTVNGTSFNDTSAVQDVTYFYRVEPNNVVGIGPNSTVISARLLYNISVDISLKESDSVVVLRWNAVPTASYYKVYISTNNGSDYSVLRVEPGIGGLKVELYLSLGHNWFYVEAFSSNDTLIGESDIVKTYYYPFSQKLKDFLEENGIFIGTGGVLIIIALLIILTQRGKIKKSSLSNYPDF